MKVLVVHNRYRLAGGEERAVALQLAALERAGIDHDLLVRDSASVGAARAARSMLGGGERDAADAVRDAGADVVHFHNIQPLLGPRALEAAREAGARVVLHLHNFRLFCSIAVCFRDGAPCFRCRRGLTVPGVALNCRGSLPESAVYATALARQLPAVLATVDRFVTLSRYAAGQLVRLGVPPDRLSVVANYLPDAEIAARSRADAGRYALVASRLSPEKGVATALDAAAITGMPIKVAGDGPLRAELERRAPHAEFVGPVPAERVRSLLDGAAVVPVPSLGGDVMPFAAIEAMGRGVPVVAARSGSLPEMVGERRCVPRGDAAAMADAIRALWDEPARRRAEGDELIGRAREMFGERRYLSELLAAYRQA